MTDRLAGLPRERLAERVSAASYGTVLVLAALALIEPDDVSSGLGWELVTGVGVATWLAHLYAEVVGGHVRTASPLDRREIVGAMADGAPILIAAVPPAFALLLGRFGILDERVALWAAVVVAILQLAGVGVLVWHATSPTGSHAWSYGTAVAAIGLAVVVLKLVVGH